MTTAMAHAPESNGMTAEQVDLVTRTICKGASKDELALFLHQCKKTGLDPLARQIYLVDRKGVKTIQVGIDGYRLVADRTGLYAGNDDPVFDSEVNPKIATVTVYKLVKGVRCPFTASARWDQYYPGKSQGWAWDKMPHLMLGKCAEALALRKAFPAELSGLYTSEEMEQAGPVVEPAEKPAPAPRAITSPSDDPPDAALVNELTEALNGCKNLAELADVKTTLSAKKKDLTPAGQKHLAGIYNGLFGSLPAASDDETDDGYAGDHALPHTRQAMPVH